MSHAHLDYSGDDPKGCVDLGHGVCIRPWRTLDGQTTFMVAHERNVPFDPQKHASERCEGRVPTGPDGWQIVSGSLEEGDLTLTPSIWCQDPSGVCGGSHGFIQNGQWVPA